MSCSFMWLVLLLTLMVSNVFGDVPNPNASPRNRPRPEPAQRAKVTAPVQIKNADLAKDGEDLVAKISIPRTLLAKLAVGEFPAGAAGAIPRESGLPWWSTVIAGIALACGAMAILLNLRSYKLTRMATAAGVIGAVLAGGYALADLRLPDKAPAENVLLEIVDEGTTIVITLGKK